MKKRLFILTLLSTTALSFASPISTPNNVNDTPIVSNGGGTVSGSGQCQAYQSDGSIVDLSKASRVTFYGGGSGCGSSGGYLSVEIAKHSGTGFIKRAGNDSRFIADSIGGYWTQGTAMGLFINNTTNQSDFIAGVGSGGGGNLFGHCGSGGGWYGESVPFSSGGSVYGGGKWFSTGTSMFDPNSDIFPGVGFYGATHVPWEKITWPNSGGGASSISAFYNIPTKDYTSPGASFTLMGYKTPNLSNTDAIVYVCGQ